MQLSSANLIRTCDMLMTLLAMYNYNFTVPLGMLIMNILVERR